MYLRLDHRATRLLRHVPFISAYMQASLGTVTRGASNITIASGCKPMQVRDKNKNFSYSVFLIAGSIVIGSVPIAIIGGLSGFEHGSSSQAQRVWIIAWLALGIAIGPISYFAPTYMSYSMEDAGSATYAKLIMLVYAVPAFGGFVVVAKMLWEYGRCISLY